jgi:hypothetical protein
VAEVGVGVEWCVVVFCVGAGPAASVVANMQHVFALISNFAWLCAYRVPEPSAEQFYDYVEEDQ